MTQETMLLLGRMLVSGSGESLVNHEALNRAQQLISEQADSLDIEQLPDEMAIDLLSRASDLTQQLLKTEREIQLLCAEASQLTARDTE